jgi:arylsulfatase A
VRMGRWKGIRNNAAKQPDAPIELDDLERDLGGTTNAAAANPQVVRRIEAVMKSSHTRAVVPPWNFTTASAAR